MSELLYRQDPYLQEAPAQVIGHTPEGGILLDRPLFYPLGGGQPGDSGHLLWRGGRIAIATTLRTSSGAVALVPADAVALPGPGEQVHQRLDWERRYGHMRIHTALHLLSVVIPMPVTGGQINAGKGRLDFDMPALPEPIERLNERLNALVSQDLRVSEDWITEAALEANPDLVKTLNARPPRSQGRLRLIRIGEGAGQIDLQPCGGTHVARTGEIGALIVDKIEKKGRINRRVTVRLER